MLVRPVHPAGADVDRLLVVMSDIEMGAGGDVDDFPHSDFLGELILTYNAAPYTDLRVDLVFNGDTFDLLKTRYLDAYPHNVTPDVALGKISRVAAAHPRFFEAVRLFLAHRGAPRSVHFVVGNHDFELLFEEVQGFVRSLCGGSGAVHFPGFGLQLGRVHIEHGSQFDALFRVRPEAPFVQSNGRRMLRLPWASVALLDVVMPFQDLLHFHDRLQPRNAVMNLMPELRELFVGAFWSYYTRDYWKGFFGPRDPVKRMTWTMLKQVGGRLFSKDADVTMDAAYHQRMIHRDDFDLYLVGHLHRAGWWTHGSRKTLQTGCFRNEYMVNDDGTRLTPLTKVYAEVYMRDGRPVRSHLVEVEGPPAPEGYVPNSIFEVLPVVREMLGPDEQLDEAHEAQAELEAKEAREGAGDAKRAS